MLAHLVGQAATLRLDGSQRNGKATVRAFTLIELMVVVTIVIILVALLIPAVNRSREISKGSACGANLRGIASAAAVYTTENEQYIPTYTLGNQTVGINSKQKWWYTSYGYDTPNTATQMNQFEDAQNSILSALTSTKIAICPSEANYNMIPYDFVNLSPLYTNVDYSPYNTTPGNYYMTANGYALNSQTGYSTNGAFGRNNNKTKPRLLTAVDNPQNTVYFFESYALANVSTTSPVYLKSISNGGYSSTGPSGSVAASVAVSAQFHGRHLKNGNVAWMDGHVSLEPLYLPADMPLTFNRYNVPLYNIYSANDIGYLTGDDHSEPWTTFVYNSTHVPGNASAVSYGPAWSIFHRNKATFDQ